MKHKPKPKGSVLAALDIGSSKIACFIARITDDEGNFEVLGVGHQASQGIKSGAVVDLAAAEGSIRHTVHAAENMAAEAMKARRKDESASPAGTRRSSRCRMKLTSTVSTRTMHNCNAHPILSLSISNIE